MRYPDRLQAGLTGARKSHPSHDGCSGSPGLSLTSCHLPLTWPAAGAAAAAARHAANSAPRQTLIASSQAVLLQLAGG